MASLRLCASAEYKITGKAHYENLIVEAQTIKIKLPALLISQE